MELCLSTRCVGCIGFTFSTRLVPMCFASAHAAWVAFFFAVGVLHDSQLCLSTRCVGCIRWQRFNPPCRFSLPQHTLRGLHSQYLQLCCIFPSFASAHAAWVALRCFPYPDQSETSLPQHTLRGLHWQKHIKYFALFCRMCCKLVDSFSVEQRMLTALTIFPDFSAAKATYVAIIDSLGRTIDRFLWCEHPVFFLLTSTSPDAHTGRCLWHLA